MRDEKLDVLRFIGLAMIILAHVNPPEWIFQLRNFDVPLMVIISGVAFGLSYKGEVYSAYVWKRVKRLLFPAWIFLTVYFSVMYFFNFPKPLPATQKIWESYFLLDGIGYVWIIRVFLLMALLAPFILKFTEKYTSNTGYYLSLMAIYAIYELALYIFQSSLTTPVGSLVKNTLFYIIPYAIVFSLGLRFSSAASSSLIVAGVISGIIFVVIAIALFFNLKGIVYTQAFKYPPQLYYLSYALSVAFILWCCIDVLMPYLKRLFFYPFIEFIARNSLWAYLWHIPFVDLFNVEFYFRYPLVFLCACIMTYIQINMVSKIVVPRVSNDGAKKNIKVLFTG